MDPTAFNYNQQANTDDGSCIPIVLGCMDPTAFNYNQQANTDDDSCVPVIYGCTDPTAFNYNQANTDDGSCIAVVIGCMDSTAFNYNSQANVNDQSCVYSGCTDQLSWNYNPEASVDDGSCFEIPDCNSGQNLVEIEISFDSNLQPFCDNNDCLDLLVELNDGTQIIFLLIQFRKLLITLFVYHHHVVMNYHFLDL